MSDPLAIPKRKDKARAGPSTRTPATPLDTATMPSPQDPFSYYDTRLSPASIDSCIGYTPTSASPNSPLASTSMAKDKGKGKATSFSMARSISGESAGSGSPWGRSDRRMSLLSSSISRSEHTVVNVGGSDGNLRLITCVKASQGFDWNQDIFLPSYAAGGHDYTAELEQRRDPVQDIFVTDEEAESMFPR